MAECWMAWHGGASYAPPEIPGDLEHFDSLRALADSFERRSWSSETYYPCVSDDEPEDGGPEGWIFLAPVADERDNYPDRIIRFGPRGGVRIEQA